MDNFLLQSLAAFILFFAIVFASCKFVSHVPKCLEYRPFSCSTCLTFWSNTFAFLVLGIGMKWWVFLGLGLILTVLNAIAQWHDQKENTVSIYNTEDDEDGE